jgi:hypothetical protein
MNQLYTMSGDDGGGDPLVSIPNTTVKPSSANGTWTAGSWESRTLPDNPKKSPVCGGFFGFQLAIWINARYNHYKIRSFVFTAEIIR